MFLKIIKRFLKNIMGTTLFGIGILFMIVAGVTVFVGIPSILKGDNATKLGALVSATLATVISGAIALYLGKMGMKLLGYVVYNENKKRGNIQNNFEEADRSEAIIQEEAIQREIDRQRFEKEMEELYREDEIRKQEEAIQREINRQRFEKEMEELYREDEIRKQVEKLRREEEVQRRYEEMRRKDEAIAEEKRLAAEARRHAERNVSRIDGMEGHEFEYFCADLLRKNGFMNVAVTRGSGDQGVDILADKDGIKYAIQCKNYATVLSNKPIQEVSAGRMFYNCHVGVVMTNSTFTQGAINLAASTNVLLWDRDMIRQLMLHAYKN